MQIFKIKTLYKFITIYMILLHGINILIRKALIKKLVHFMRVETFLIQFQKMK